MLTCWCNLRIESGSEVQENPGILVDRRVRRIWLLIVSYQYDNPSKNYRTHNNWIFQSCFGSSDGYDNLVVNCFNSFFEWQQIAIDCSVGSKIALVEIG